MHRLQNSTFPVLITYVMRCRKCRIEISEETYCHAGNGMPYPSIPPDWSVLNGELICPEHTIDIKDTNNDQSSI
jgi:hypothetical protein